MEVHGTIGSAEQALTVRRAFGEPYRQDGVTVIPVARVSGGAGTGGGDSSHGKGEGSGFGIWVDPVGVFRLQNDRVTWHPVVDVNRIVTRAAIVSVVALLAVRSVVQGGRSRRR